ncbi:MAG: type IV pilus assembly protein PilM, partial [Planctomycetaceae bacterium]|nr:type IV pilus assembly protein PilM [Planctomycetaceae bacterium]
MAENQAVWGIEIGQAGLKAIRLRYAEAAGQVIAAAFDYVPHPKILSQPDASPDELIRQALDTFLSRNQIGNDLVAIAVPGQTALAKFIQLPPVEAGRVAEIIKYEARQQIPFALEDVEWDFQTLGGGAEESGFLIDAEVGLFAMKKEQVRHHLKPFLDRKVEVEVVQIAPLGLHNFLCYDRLGVRLNAEGVEQPDYTIVLDMGADATTLLVTNGKKIWIRNVPIGGNHFTRALTKEMKLTFAKAEHLKCNATKSPDPRAVFQALRPVFNDYVSEIQRSIGFFSSVNRSAKIGRLVGVGNGFKLAGLQKFLQQNLQYEVDRVDNFNAVVGDHVLTAPLFQDNLLTFAVPYGLALQTLKLTDIHTTLLPRDIAVARKIRRKKPWAVA